MAIAFSLSSQSSVVIAQGSFVFVRTASLIFIVRWPGLCVEKGSKYGPFFPFYFSNMICLYDRETEGGVCYCSVCYAWDNFFFLFSVRNLLVLILVCKWVHFTL